MKDKMQEEKEVLSVKRKLIEDELEEKQKNLDNVESKVRKLKEVIVKKKKLQRKFIMF